MRKVGIIVKLLLTLAVLVCLAALFLWFNNPPPLREARELPCGVILRDTSGKILRVGLNKHQQDCRPISQIASNDWIVLALTASEDRRFYSHHGVDWLALGRALWQNCATMRRISGASTITMQSVRLMHPPRKRTVWVKLCETIQALRLERVMTKDEIMLNYLNRAPFGSNLTGIEAAAQGWFGKSVCDLNLGEAALLAGMVQSPTRFRPDRHPAKALKRRAYVLQRMHDLGMITAAQRVDAASVPFTLKRAPRPFLEPFFCDWAQRGLPPGDYTTTLNHELQGMVRRIADNHATAHKIDVAVVLLTPSNNTIRAWHCTGDYFGQQAGQVNTVISPRPAGSTLKPFAYALAMDRGLLTPGSVMADVPRYFGNQKPMNFSGEFLGPVTVREALIRSLNIPAIEAVELCGLLRFHATLKQLGLTTLDKPTNFYGLGLAIGNGSVTLLGLARAYACLARGGLLPPTQTEGVPKAQRVFSEGTCWMIADILGGPERSRDSLGHLADVQLPRFAWKTGTSSGFRDAWTVAWNPHWVVAVWCGYKSGRGGRETLVGKVVAAPIAWDIARQLPDAEWYQMPPEVMPREVCAVSGELPTALCQRRVASTSLRGHTLNRVCAVHVVDGSGKIMERWSPEVAEWLAKQHGRALIGSTVVPLRIISPADGSHFKIIDGLVAQEILFTPSGATGKGLLAWFHNDALIGTDATLRWKPLPGTHRFVCATESGESDTIVITVD